MSSSVVGRLAPSPTGAQHVGNARTYLLAWLSVRSRGGRIVLRMEDIDSPRIKAGAAQQALDDLRWLGIDWDEGPDIGGPHQPYQQTQRIAFYEAAIEKLKAAERIYPCSCTRSDVLAAASAPHANQEGPIYPGTCSRRSVDDARRLSPGTYCWRFRTTDDVRTFADGVAKSQSLRVLSTLGDFVIQKNDGSPAYQLAVVVDDHLMGVTEVLRGDDLLPSAFRQLELYEFFGWPPPQFVHVPLVVGSDGRRLAKRHGDTRLSLLREQGHGPQRLLGMLAWSCGWLNKPQPVSAREVVSLFRLNCLPRDPFVFTNVLHEWLFHGER